MGGLSRYIASEITPATSRFDGTYVSSHSWNEYKLEIPKFPQKKGIWDMTFVPEKGIFGTVAVFPTACLQNQVVSNTSSHKVSQRTSAFKKTSKDVSNKNISTSDCVDLFKLRRFWIQRSHLQIYQKNDRKRFWFAAFDLWIQSRPLHLTVL